MLRVGPENIAEAPLYAVPNHGVADAPAAYYAEQPPLPGDGKAMDDERVPGDGPAVADGAREIPPAPHARGAREAEASFVVTGQGRVIPLGACAPWPGGDVRRDGRPAWPYGS